MERNISVKFLNDGLVCETIINCSNKNDKHNTTRTILKSNIPSCLHKNYWERHKLSMQDVHLLVNYIDSKSLWLACMALGIDLPPGCIKYSYDTVEGILVSGKTTALKKLLKMQTASGTINMLSKTDDHHPPIPNYFVGRETLAKVSTIIVPNLSIFNSKSVPGIFVFLDINWVPTAVEGYGVILTRISPIENFVYCDVLISKPQLCDYGGIYYGLTDECIRLLE